MAGVIIDRWDFAAILKDAAKSFRWTPDEVWKLTPFEVVAIFGKPPAGDVVDKLDVLRRHNELRARSGKRPNVPRWWGRPKVKRKRGV